MDNKQQVFREQLKLLHQHTPFMLITTSTVGSIVVFALWQQTNRFQLLSWLLSIYLISIIRFIDWKWFWLDTTETIKIKRRKYLLTAFSGLSGLIWGGAGLFFLNIENIFASLLISMTLPAMVAGSTASLSILLSAYFAYAIPALSLIAYRLFSLDDRVFTAAGILTLLFLAANLMFARTLNRSVIESIKLRFQNLKLVEKYKLEKQGAELATKKAENANVAKSKFLAAASHDLRQPLHALMLNATVLNERQQESANQPVINNIINSVRSLETLFNSLLDISKLDAGIVTPDIMHFKLQSILNRLKVDCQFFAKEKGLLLDIPKTDVCLYSDPTLIERILRNIIMNGIRYTESGCVGLVIEPNSETVSLKIIDTGIGINKKNKKYIFEEFVQLDNPERDRSKGLGLGLSIVDRLCELLDCYVNVESSPGKGSVFSFTITKGDEKLAINEISSQVIYRPTPLDHFIVVIDDEKTIRDGLKTLLEDWQCTVLAFGSEQEALDELKEYEYAPDVLLVDYRLRQNKTGIEAIKAINKLFDEEIPALIITGDTASDRLKEAENSGYRLLHKPLHPSQLRSFLQKLPKHD